MKYYDALADKIAHIHLKDMRYATAQDMMADTAEDGIAKMTGAATGTGIVDLKTVGSQQRISREDAIKQML